MGLTNGEVQKSLRASFYDGFFACAMTGFVQDYLTPFLLLLKATTAHIGMLNALPNFFASLIQLRSADLTEKLGSRKRMIIIFVFLQAMTLLPMTFIAISGTASPLFFIFIVVLFASFGALGAPAWGSLMSDLVEKEKRGEYFGWRNRTLGFVAVGAAFIAGFILNMFKKINIYAGFAIIFGFALIFRMISCYFLTKMQEPSISYNKEHCFSFVDFISNLRKSNFAKFVLFVSTMSFSVNLASPFFSVLMLRDMHFSYLLYTLITITATLMVYIFIQRWGLLADKVGNLKVIKFTSPLIGFIPVFWILNRHPATLFLAQIFSGFAWAGFNLCATNFIYDAVTPEKRTRCIAYFNVFNGIGLCLGALMGGFLLKWLPPLLGYKILMLFLISSILRLIIGFLIPIKLKEVRPVEKIKSADLFLSVIGAKPLLGIERKTLKT